MITYQDIQKYIIDTLGKIRAETKWQKCNKNNLKEETSIKDSVVFNSVHSEKNKYKDPYPPKYN